MVEKRFEKLGMPDIERFENYLPTAFNSELTLLQKVNKIIFDLIETNKLTNEMVDYLNKFIEKFDEKLYKSVGDVLQVWLDDGLLADVVRESISEEVIEARTDNNEKTYSNLKDRLNQEQVSIETALSEISRLNNEYIDYTTKQHYNVVELNLVTKRLGENEYDVLVDDLVSFADSHENSVLIFPNGKFYFDKGMEFKKKISIKLEGSELIANKAMQFLVSFNQTVHSNNMGYFSGLGFLNGNGLALDGIRISNLSKFLITNLNLLNFPRRGILAHTRGSGVRISSCTLMNPGNRTPDYLTDNVGIEINDMADNTLSDIVIQNFTIGVLTNTNANYARHVHYWVTSQWVPNSVAFEARATTSGAWIWCIECVADTAEIGWKTNSSMYIYGCRYLFNNLFVGGVKRGFLEFINIVGDNIGVVLINDSVANNETSLPIYDTSKTFEKNIPFYFTYMIKNLLIRTSAPVTRNMLELNDGVSRSFTPTVKGSTSGDTLASIYTNAVYQRNGRVVYYSIALQGSLAGISGTLRVGGLPFKSRGASSAVPCTSPTILFAENVVGGMIASNSDYITFTKKNSTSLQVEDLTTGNLTLFMTGIYFV